MKIIKNITEYIYTKLPKSLRKRIDLVVADVNLREVLHGSTAYFILRLIGYLLGYAFTLIIASSYGTAVLGYVMFSIITLNFVSTLSSFGLETSVLAMVSRYNASNEYNYFSEILLKAYTIALIFGIVSTSLIYFNSEYISFLFFNSNKLSPYLRLIILAVIPLTLVKINSHFLRALKEIGPFVLYNNILTYLGCIVFIYSTSVILNYKLSLGFYFIISTILTLLFSSIHVLKILRSRYTCISRSNSRIGFKELINSSKPNFYISFLDNFKIWMCTSAVGYLLNESDVGVFSLTIKLATASSILTASIYSIAMPKFGEHFGRSDQVSLQKTLSFASKYNFYITTPLTFCVIAISPIVLNYLEQEFYKGLLPLLLLTLSQFVEALAGSSNYILQMINKQKIHQKVILASTVVLIVMNFVLIPYLGLLGAASSILLSTLVQEILLIFYCKRNLNLTTYYIPYLNKFYNAEYM